VYTASGRALNRPKNSISLDCLLVVFLGLPRVAGLAVAVAAGVALSEPERFGFGPAAEERFAASIASSLARLVCQPMIARCDRLRVA